MRPPRASLTEELLWLRGRQLDEAPLSEIDAYDRAAAAAAEAGVPENALSVGAPAPDLRAIGTVPVVLIWYHSRSSPFCRAVLARAAEYAAAGRVVFMAACTIAEPFGVCYEPPTEYRALLGIGQRRIALAATYLIGADGRIAYAHLHPDPRFRADPAEVIRARAEGV